MTDPSLTPAAPAPEPARTPRSRRRLVAVGAGAAVAVALLGGGAFAYTQLSGGGPQPHDVMPASMQTYARLDLDPSASQKVELFRLLRQVPEAAKALGDAEDADLRQLVIEKALDAECDDVDYDTDVAPWLGERIGVGANLSDEQVLVAAQVTDEAKARTGIDALSECAGQEVGIAFLDGYALLSDSQKTVDDALDATAKGTLGDKTAFSDAMDELGEPGIASFWIDGEALAESLPSLGLPTEDLAPLDQIKGIGTAAFALRVDGSAIELAGISGLTEAYDVDPSPITDLPADTVVAASLSGLGTQVGPQYQAFIDQISSITGSADEAFGLEQPESVDIDPDVLAQMDADTRELYEDYLDETQAPPMSIEDSIEELETEFGIALPEDLATLLGDSITVAIGEKNLDRLPTFDGPDDVADLDLAVRTQGDVAKTKAVMDRLVGFAEDAGLSLVSQETDDGAVLATNADAAEAVTGGGNLGDDNGFTAVLPYGADTTQGIYVDIAAIIESIRASDPSPDVLDGVKQVESLQGFGLSAAKVGDDRAAFSVRLAFAG